MILAGLLLATFSALAQSADREKPKIKNFGSSLKGIKWDSVKNAAVEIKPADEKGSDAGEDVVRVETSLVVSSILVLDGQGSPVQGLTRDDFAVAEDGQPQQVGSFSLGDNTAVPRSIVLIIDYSGSQAPFIGTSVEAAKTLVDKLAPRDRMAIVTDDVELLVDFTSDKKKLKEKLEFLKMKSTSNAYWVTHLRAGERRYGRSAQYSALMATLKEAFGDEDQRPVIIFQTDGDELGYLRQSILEPCIPDDLPPDKKKEAEARWKQGWLNPRERGREFSLDDVYRAAQRSRATIYTVMPGFGRLIGLTPDQQLERLRAFKEKFLSGLKHPIIKRQTEEAMKRAPVGVLRCEARMWLKMQSALAVLSTVTGGWTDFLEDPSQADEIYSHIFSDINRRYVIGYYPTNREHDGKRRKINIEVRGHPEYTVMGRKSYYAPGAEQ